MIGKTTVAMKDSRLAPGQVLPPSDLLTTEPDLLKQQNRPLPTRRLGQPKTMKPRYDAALKVRQVIGEAADFKLQRRDDIAPAYYAKLGMMGWGEEAGEFEYVLALGWGEDEVDKGLGA